MQEHNVPDWYIDSCNKIKYLFPKAHAAAYVTNAFRIAWFKVHIPKAYYTAYYTIRADAFDSEVMCHGHERVKNKMKEIELLGNAATQKDKDMYETLELVNEMYYQLIFTSQVQHALKWKMKEYDHHLTVYQALAELLQMELKKLGKMENLCALTT